MAEKTFNSRIVHKHDTEENWLKATSFTPKQGEIIIYDIDDTYSYERIKIGDGSQNVNSLPFYAGSWEDLSDKPFWSEGPTVVEWDGNTDGLAVSSDGTAYKVSDLKPSSSEAVGGKLTFSDGSVVEITSDIVEDHGYIISIYYNTVLINITNGSTFNADLGITLPEPGVYLQKNTYNQIVSFSYGEEIVHVLDEKFIPDTIARTSDIPKQVIDDALSSTSTNPVQNKVVNAAISNLSDLVGDTTISEQINTAIVGNYAPIDDPEFTSSISMGRKADSDVGSESVAIGRDVVASADYCCAIGDEVSATGLVANAEGVETVASGDWSHAEGYKSKAVGEGCHAEGYETEAGGYFCHTEGLGTISYDNYQHVQGQYNLEDWSHSYAHIVGNGSSSARSNAHTLDWDGNAWFAGNVYIGGTSQNDAAKLTPGVMPNLLDNWYFADPVNSQGLTTYPSGTYAVDRWFMRSVQGNVVDGGFQVYNESGISFYGITQALNNPTQYCGKTVTFTVKLAEVNVASAIEIKIASASSVSAVGTVINELKTITSAGTYSVTATIPDTLPNTTLAVWIACRDATIGANFVLESAKLEFGKMSTLDAETLPNKADQLVRCSNYDVSGAFLDSLLATQAFVLKYAPKITSITLTANSWTFSSNAYYQDVALSCVTTTSKIDLQPTYAQLAEWQSDGLAFSTVSQNGAVRVWVTDAAPKENVTIQVSVQEVLEV